VSSPSRSSSTSSNSASTYASVPAAPISAESPRAPSSSPIAFELNIEDDGVWYALKGGYDADFRKYGPGQLILLEILRHAYDRGLASYEFLGSDDAYKLQWTGRVRERWLFQAFARVAGLPEYVLYRYGRPLARKVLRR